MPIDPYTQNCLAELDKAIEGLRQRTTETESENDVTIRVELSFRSIATQLHLLLCLGSRDFDNASRAVLDVCEPLAREEIIFQNPKLMTKMIDVLETARMNVALFQSMIEREA